MSASRLHSATSPYLAQHADNPVDWWPWCEEALAEARRTDRPILLSIGYSACHWCHVMAHESFEDAATADLMNTLYLNIKVDREERPDLDKIYQRAHQLLTQRAGGWPLTVFLTPDDLTPFFAGTYFPPLARHGLPAFRDLLRQVEQAYRNRRDAIDAQNGRLREALRMIDEPGDTQQTGPGCIEDAVNQLGRQFDAQHGGFGAAPKFPHPSSLRLLLREGLRASQDEVLHMALFSLEQMANGGIHDHLGGGFCRYSVDRTWTIPHFEKMLYDNGQLLALYAEAWASCGHRPLFRHVCERTAEWIVGEMQSADGGYFASLDADSEGHEGLYYLWTPAEVVALLEPLEYRVFAMRFGLNLAANFEGRWHLHCTATTDQISAKLGLEPREVRRLLASARDKLLVERGKRVRPARDEKILTSWNALTIQGMAAAGRLLGRPEWVESASAALEYLIRHHWQDGRLLASSRDGRAHLNAYLDDHAYLIAAILELLQARWDSGHLQFAVQVADRLLAHFQDLRHGGFFFTSDDHETLVHRPKPLSDEAIPSGNGIALEALLGLAHLTGETRFHTAASRLLENCGPAMQRMPQAHSSLLEGMRQHLHPPQLWLICGAAPSLAEWQAAVQTRPAAPGDRLYLIPDTAEGLAGRLAALRRPDGRTRAYRCSGFQCDAPIERIEDLTTGQ